MVATRSQSKNQSANVKCIAKVAKRPRKCSAPDMAGPGGASSTTTPTQDPASSTAPTTRFAISKIFFNKPKENPIDPAKITKNANPPPINIFDKTSSDVRNLLDKNINYYTLKLLRNCLQVFNNNTNDYLNAIELFKSANFHYYTYPVITTPMTRFVLYGLGNEDIADITTDLKEYGFNPVDITKMNLARAKMDNTQNFLVQFDADDRVTLAVIRRAKYICHTVIRWQPYKPSKKRFKMCRNCFRMNHGTASCNMPARCMFCSENHKSVDCHLLIEKRNNGDHSIAAERLKCANCSGQHTAADPNCPNTLNFLQKKFGKAQKGLQAPVPQSSVTYQRAGG